MSYGNHCSSPPCKHQPIPFSLSCSSETGLDHSIPSQQLLGDRVKPYWHPAETNCSFSRAQMFKFILGFQDHPIKASRRCPTHQGKGSTSQETQRKVRRSHLRLPEMPFSLPVFCKAPAHPSAPNGSPPLATADWSNHSLPCTALYSMWCFTLEHRLWAAAHLCGCFSGELLSHLFIANTQSYVWNLECAQQMFLWWSPVSRSYPANEGRNKILCAPGTEFIAAPMVEAIIECLHFLLQRR